MPPAVSGPPLLVVLSGPSGAGKDAVLNRLKQSGLDFCHVTTMTTRPMRTREIDGTDYYFVTVEHFQQLIRAGGLMEYAEVYGNWYGVPKSQVTSGLDAGKDVILKIDVQGAATVRKMASNALFIFMVPGSFEELQERLSQRMTESTPEMELRLKTAADEMKQGNGFDRQVVNSKDNLEQAVADIDATIAEEKGRAGRAPIQIL